MKHSLTLHQYICVNFLDIIARVIYIEVHSLLILHSVEALAASETLDPAPEPLAIHEKTEHAGQADHHEHLVHHEQDFENRVEARAIPLRFVCDGQADEKGGKGEHIAKHHDIIEVLGLGNAAHAAEPAESDPYQL